MFCRRSRHGSKRKQHMLALPGCPLAHVMDAARAVLCRLPRSRHSHHLAFAWKAELAEEVLAGKHSKQPRVRER